MMPTANADGVRIAYSDSGAGPGLPLVCLTGWCSSRARYERFIPLAVAARRVIAIDWRGHGDSDVPRSDFGLDELVDDVLAVVETAGLEEFAVASASHSGWVAIELRRRLGERVQRIAHMDWLVVEPPAQYLELIRRLQSKDTWSSARETLFDIWRGGLEDPAIEDTINVMNRHGVQMWMRSGREIEASYMEHGSPLAALSRLESHPDVLHVYGQPPDPIYLERQQAFAADHDWFDVSRVSARTHFTMVELPEQTAAALDAFLAPG